MSGTCAIVFVTIDYDDQPRRRSLIYASSACEREERLSVKTIRVTIWRYFHGNDRRGIYRCSFQDSGRERFSVLRTFTTLIEEQNSSCSENDFAATCCLPPTWSQWFTRLRTNRKYLCRNYSIPTETCPFSLGL